MKKIVLFFILSLILMSNQLVVASPKEELPINNWQAIDFGNGNNNTFYFNKASIHYEVKDGKVNKDILVYEEKKVNRDGFTLDNGYYSITKAKINIKTNRMFLGEETFYTPKGKVRWVDTPTYLIWYSINPGTMGADRFNAVLDYAKNNLEQIEKQTQEYLTKLKENVKK